MSKQSIDEMFKSYGYSDLFETPEDTKLLEFIQKNIGSMPTSKKDMTPEFKTVGGVINYYAKKLTYLGLAFDEAVKKGEVEVISERPSNALTLCMNRKVTLFKDSQSFTGIKEGEYTFRYDYPLNEVVEVTHNLTEDDDISQVLQIAAMDYASIPDDNWWGHIIEDLYFERVTVDLEKKTVSFTIGS